MDWRNDGFARGRYTETDSLIAIQSALVAGHRPLGLPVRR